MAYPTEHQISDVGARTSTPNPTTGIAFSSFLIPVGRFYRYGEARFGESFFVEFPYRFLPKRSGVRPQIGDNGGMKRLKLRKTLHLAGSIGGREGVQ